MYPFMFPSVMAALLPGLLLQAVAPNGDVFYSQPDVNLVRKVDLATGIVNTITRECPFPVLLIHLVIQPHAAPQANSAM